jgi:xylulose-5-phosphate/fructose-6-phosphate phosphoketolase
MTSSPACWVTWGTSPGQSFVYAHMSRLIAHTGQSAIYLAGPGHGGPALVAATWLEGVYTEIYPDVTRDAKGMHRHFRQFRARVVSPATCR